MTILQVKYLMLLLLFAFGVSLGLSPLQDPDLGWHVVAGLWMLKERTIPHEDFLTNISSPWVSYSWGAEILFGLMYHAFGFVGLQMSQLFIVVGSILLLFYLLEGTISYWLKKESALGVLIAAGVTFGAMIFISPIWALRPQVISVALFSVLLFLAQTNRLTAKYLLPLVIIWVNVHVYWVLVPAVAGLYLLCDGSGSLRFQIWRSVGWTLMLLASAVVNPYGTEMYQVVEQYLAQHKVAYETISEFDHLGPAAGYVFWTYLLVIVSVVATARKWFRLVKKSTTVTLLLFAVLALLRLKFVPLFGVAMAFFMIELLVKVRAESFCEVVLSGPSERKMTLRRRIVFLIIIFISICIIAIQPAPSLSAARVEMREIVTRLVAMPEFNDRSEVTVMNHLNDGGWLALFLYLEANAAMKESKFKTMFDGRTLVMGEKRLSIFRDVLVNEEARKKMYQLPNIDVIFVPTSSNLSLGLNNDSHFKTFYESDNWSVFVRTS